MNILINSLILSLIVLFWVASCWDGFINSWIKKVINESSWIAKPIYICNICATPWYGSILYWMFIHNNIQDYFLTIGVASGISTVFYLLIGIHNSLEALVNK